MALFKQIASALLVIAGAAVLSTSCRNGESVRIDALRKAAERGDAPSQLALGNEYYATKEYPKAFQWYHSAAEQGNAVGQLNLATMYYVGNGVPEDYKEAARWAAKAAAQGDAGGQSLLNECLRLQKERQKEKDDQILTEMSLQEAEDKGWVHTSYQSRHGTSTGASVLLIAVKIGGPARLSLHLTAGRILKSQVTQNMVIAGLLGHEMGYSSHISEETIILSKNSEPGRWVLTAYCTDFGKPNPIADSDFQPAETDSELACILDRGREERLSETAVQAAVWIHTDQLTYEKMNTKMRVTSEEWSAAAAIVSRCK
jgi:hypothetical protein